MDFYPHYSQKVSSEIFCFQFKRIKKILTFNDMTEDGGKNYFRYPNKSIISVEGFN